MSLGPDLGSCVYKSDFGDHVLSEHQACLVLRNPTFPFINPTKNLIKLRPRSFETKFMMELFMQDPHPII